MQNVLTSKENTKIQTNKQSKANKKLANKIYKRGNICQSAVLIAHDVLRSERSRITLWLPSQLINWLWKWIWYPRATAQTNEQGMWNSNVRFHGEKSRAKIPPVLLQEKEVLEVKGAELDNPALHLISWRSSNGLDMCQYSWAVMKTGANTRGHSDRKMLCPALPTDSCDSSMEAWREEFSHLQLFPVSPAWAAHCSPWRWWQLLAKIKKTDVFCPSLASRTGCAPKSALLLLHAQEQGGGCQSLPVLSRVIPKQYFLLLLPPSGDEGQHAHCYPTLPMRATQMSEHKILLTLFQ